MAELRQELELSCEDPPDALRARLSGRIEQTDAAFVLGWRLSGGGIVGRAIDVPNTDQPLVGRLDGMCFKMVALPDKERSTAWWPILEGEISGEQRARVTLVLRPHAEARTLVGIYRIGALLLGGASVAAALTGNAVGWLGLAFAAGFALVPGFRAKMGFELGCAAALDVLKTELQLYVGD